MPLGRTASPPIKRLMPTAHRAAAHPRSLGGAAVARPLWDYGFAASSQYGSGLRFT